MYNMLQTNMNLEAHFREIREGVIGNNGYFETPFGTQKILYADWVATGRLYRPIEERITDTLGPYFANTHSYSSETGKVTSNLYMEARDLIKKHVNADADDVLVTTGSGMTGALTRLQRIMGLKGVRPSDPKEVPVVFITHMEHHSNHVSWSETMADIVIVPPGDDLMPSPDMLDDLLEKYKDRTHKIGAFTACSNVTGEVTDHKGLAKTMHAHGGVCFFDFAASAPYVDIDMHPNEPECRMDAIFFSPHKFLGGPGACGILVFNKNLYRNEVPEIPGGGNVKWTTPWGKHRFFEGLETKEDGGTPGIIQTIKAALAIQLKEKMDTQFMATKEQALLGLFREGLKDLGEIHYLGNEHTQRIGCLSFNIQGIHYNLMVRLLNDRFGIQVRGGWSCASTFAHYLFGIDQARSSWIMDGIDGKNLENKPGWVRVSLHPVMEDLEVTYITEAIRSIVQNKDEWEKDYQYNPMTNEFEYIHGTHASSGHPSFFEL